MKLNHQFQKSRLLVMVMRERMDLNYSTWTIIIRYLNPKISSYIGPCIDRTQNILQIYQKKIFKKSKTILYEDFVSNTSRVQNCVH